MMQWESKIRHKRAALSSAIASQWAIDSIPTVEQRANVVDWPRLVLSENDVVITESPPLAILANVHAGVWSAEDVTRAFCRRAALAHQLVNCLTEILFDEAILIAQQLDRHQRETGTIKGPLHGLPMSFMDRFRVAGVETASGFVSWLGPKETPDTESLLVMHMRDLGAIPLCKTNVPQSMMLSNTANNIFGSTRSPFNRHLDAGGAAGGEGALLAMKGSPFGWCTEIAGSTRIPAAFNNLYALKTSVGRLPMLGVASAHSCLPAFSTTIGMLSADLPFLEHMARLTLGSSAYQEDPSWLDIPWRESRYLTVTQHRWELSFAVMTTDNHVRPLPPLQRALTHIAQGLRQRGYQVIEWTPPAHSPAVKTLFRIIGADGAKDIRQHIQEGREPPVTQLKSWFDESEASPGLSAYEYWGLRKSQNDYIRAYRRFWQQTSQSTVTGRPVDGVIMPVTAHAACFENDLKYFGYSAIVNCLDFTSVAIPVTCVNKDVDLVIPGVADLSLEDTETRATYNPVIQDGMPVGLQVMCQRHEEEKALALAEILRQTCNDSSGVYSFGWDQVQPLS